MLKALLRLFAFLPLPVIHALGAIFGLASLIGDPKFSRRIRHNILSVQITSSAGECRKLVKQTACEIGKGLAETFGIWFRPTIKVLKWVKACNGWEHVETALAEKKGIIFLTPHLGCFEITAIYYSAHHPINVLFRPPRKSWLASLVEEGRSRSQIQLAPTNMSGVRSLFKSLKKGEAIGILPDQVPDVGEGAWADFFGIPAYTMTLVGKLQEATGAKVLLAFGERLSWGRGYVIHIEPLDAEASPQNINAAIENLIRRCPAQYLWSYRRFKQPKMLRTHKDSATDKPVKA